MSCSFCFSNITTNPLIFDNSIFCNENCYYSLLSINQIANNFTKKKEYKNKSIGYYCHGCNEKFLESDKPKIVLNSFNWCSNDCIKKNIGLIPSVENNKITYKLGPKNPYFN